MVSNCRTCGKDFEQVQALYLICILCHLCLVLKTFPEKSGREKSANCFIRAYDEHKRLKSKAMGV